MKILSKEELVQGFFYHILRDAAKAGDIEFVMREFEKDCSAMPPLDYIEYSNKHIADYAKELAKRFLSAIKNYEGT